MRFVLHGAFEATTAAHSQMYTNHAHHYYKYTPSCWPSKTGMRACVCVCACVRACVCACLFYTCMSFFSFLFLVPGRGVGAVKGIFTWKYEEENGTKTSPLNSVTKSSFFEDKFLLQC